jgi:glutamate dehydrogenase
LDAVNCYLAFDQILQADALRQAIAALENKVSVDQQYQLLIQLEQTLMYFCRWAIAHGRIIQPEISTINCYSRYLKNFDEYVIRHLPDCWQEQLKQHQQAQIPAALAQKLVFIANSQNFPFIMLLVTETQQDFTTVLTLLNDITDTLGLAEIQQQLVNMPLRDVWERSVCNDLQEDMQRFSGRLLKKIQANQVETCADYFELQPDKQHIKQYRRLYLEIQNALPINLLPYVALIRKLGDLL